MEIYSFVKFRAAVGKENAVVEAIHSVLAATREEAGCVRIQAFRGTNDGRIFYIHSRWKSAEAFEGHAKLQHTAEFLQKMDGLIEQPREVTRTELID